MMVAETFQKQKPFGTQIILAVFSEPSFKMLKVTLFVEALERFLM